MSLDVDELNTALDPGRALCEALNPGMDAALTARYDALLPGFAETLTEFAFGSIHARGVVDEKTRMLATIAAPTGQGRQTRPQLMVNIAGARRARASRENVAEIIMQMGLYGGPPVKINALNAALEVFEEEGPQQ
jgi:4-carboxymuconolactone decarboxylase